MDVYWIAFLVTFGALLAVDIWLHRPGHELRTRPAVWWAVICVVVGLAFVIIPWMRGGGGSAQEYLGAFLMEKALSMDNLFLFLVIFDGLSIPQRHQGTVLTLGILGALVFRAVFIMAGIAILERLHWVVYVMSGILLLAAIRTFREDPSSQEESKMVRWLSRRLPVTDSVESGKFVTRENGKRVVTPLLLALIAIELTDVVFAIDSVPAALSVTRDQFLVYSSNAFAIVGLRALYFVMAHTLSRLAYLHYGLAVILAFAAVKLAISEWVHISPAISIGVVVGTLVVSSVASLRARSSSDARTADAS